MIATGTPTYIISIKIVTHICCRNFHLHKCCINAFNSVIAIETVTCLIGTKRFTNIIVVESTTCIIAMKPQNLHNCNRCWHLHNCYSMIAIKSVSCIVPTETATVELTAETFTCRNGASQRSF